MRCFPYAHKAGSLHTKPERRIFLTANRAIFLIRMDFLRILVHVHKYAELGPPFRPCTLAYRLSLGKTLAVNPTGTLPGS